MSRFLRPSLASFAAYTPGEQPRERKFIKLNTNEMPYPPSPAVAAAVTVDEINSLNLYPDPTCRKLKESIAASCGVLPENIVVGNGSDEILAYAFMAFCGDGNETVFPTVTYGFYEVFAELYRIKYNKIPLAADFSINISDYIGINKNIFIANPNAPTGILLSCEDIEKIVKSNPDNIVLIDEAYIAFGGRSCCDLIEKYDNLIVSRTFSKSHALAGARLGFSISCPALARDLEKIRYSQNPYNINRLTMAAGIAACYDGEYYRSCCDKIAKSREYAADALKKRGFNVLPSSANFIFVSHPQMSGEELYSRLYALGILVRHFKTPEICDFLRITIGTEQEVEALLSSVDKIIRR